MAPGPLQRRPTPFRSAARYIVGVEGEREEPWYFNGLIDRRLVPRPQRVDLVVLPAEDGASAPNQIVHRVQAYLDNLSLRPFDEVWLVMDRDRWKKQTLNTVFQDAQNAGWSTAMSAPCFEVWLQLHLTETPAGATAKGCKSAWRKHREQAPDRSWPFTTQHVRDAIRRANQSDPGSAWPPEQGLSSQVHRLVAKLMDERGP